REARAGGVLDALIDWKNREVAGVAQATVAEHALEVREHADVAVGDGVNLIDEIRTGQMQAILGNFRILESEERFGFGAEEALDFAAAGRCCHCFSLVLCRPKFTSG